MYIVHTDTQNQTRVSTTIFTKMNLFHQKCVQGYRFAAHLNTYVNKNQSKKLFFYEIYKCIVLSCEPFYTFYFSLITRERARLFSCIRFAIKFILKSIEIEQIKFNVECRFTLLRFDLHVIQ